MEVNVVLSPSRSRITPLSDRLVKICRLVMMSFGKEPKIHSNEV